MEALSICKAKIMAVDKVKWTCTVLPEGGQGAPNTDIPINPILIGEDGRGMYYLPEVGSIVWLAELPTYGFFILMGSSLPYDGSGEDETKSLDADHRMGRPRLEPGDMTMTGQPGSEVLVRKNGVVEIGSSYMSRRYYLPLEYFIRDFTKKYEMITAGGGYSFKTDDFAQNWGSFTTQMNTDPDSTNGLEEVSVAKMPTKFNLTVKEFAQDKDPVLELSVGRIDLDDKSKLIGGHDWKDIVFEMLLHNPNEDSQAQDGKKKGGTVRIYMDKRGTINSAFFGGRYTKVHETDKLVAASYRRVVTGLDSVSAQTRSVTVEKSDTVVVKGSATRNFQGGLDLTVKGKFNFNLESPLNLVSGATTSVVNGASSTSVMGEMAVDCSRGYKVGAGGSLTQVSGGATEIIASNKINPKPTGLLLKTMGGKVKITSVPMNGVTAYSTGVEIATQGGVMLCDDIGNIYMRNSASQSTIQITSGGVAMSTPGGEVTLSTSGEVALGGPLNSAGAGQGKVVTTLTHPFCFVTGLPIKGSSTVSAFSSVPIGSVGPKVPAVPYVNVMSAAEAAIAAANAADKS